MDALLLAVVEELGGGVVGVQLDLVDGRGNLEAGVVEELLEVLDGEVGDADVLDAARGGELLHLSPGVEEVPVGVVLLEVIGVGAGGPVLRFDVSIRADALLEQYDAYHQVQVDIVKAERLQRRLNALFDPLVPGVVELGGNPNLFTGNTRVLDSLADLMLVSVRQCGINVSVALLQRHLDSLAHFVGLRLPGTEAHSGHLSPGVEGEGLLGPLILCHFGESSSEHVNSERYRK